MEDLKERFQINLHLSAIMFSKTFIFMSPTWSYLAIYLTEISFKTFKDSFFFEKITEENKTKQNNFIMAKFLYYSKVSNCNYLYV